MSILVVGSVAFDSIETPFGKAPRILGGSASYFSVAASFFAPVSLVAVVGEDFGPKEEAAFSGRPIDLRGLERAKGATFHWAGRYLDDLNSRETIRTDLNVFESFKPKIPEAYRSSEHVFLGNIDPTLQRDVLEQVRSPKLVACDTMNFWITGALPELRKTLSRVQVLLINDGEARALAGEWNLVKAARTIRSMGPRVLVVKKGEHGVVMFGEQGVFGAPAYPLEEVFDPTGAGDTFAGGFLGYLASSKEQGEGALRRAVIMGSTLASFCVEAFGLERLLKLTRPEIDERFSRFTKLTSVDPGAA
jgi:sugar/nucleoside kinase (ribokinase family)